MDRKENPFKNLYLWSGELCLDFLNTADKYGEDFHHLFLWGEKMNLLSADHVQELERIAGSSPEEAENIYLRAQKLRTILTRIFTAITEGKSPDKQDFAVFNEFVADAMGHLQIISAQTGFSWKLCETHGKGEEILHAVIFSAIHVIVDELKKLKKCANPECGWFFLDQSRNQSRRWCDMKICGNRAKARRNYKRKKQSQS